ncbi:shikimate dehydrogenase [Microbacterium betulae]|uniref:Shikimate dehydrogenase n=1 Tax=Microbacterium betulae TaxID=2981139 RepID=A0AA97FHD2_9MICO|nr:shikimate dehydrogenase [Microbacterium sp. AB]WOF21532.1 shikimate dehydrogenase [Microbacterium sp. AB]
MSETRLEVWGAPIEHSRSPQLHGAAYRVLGLDWTFGRRLVERAAFDQALAGIGAGWRGLAVTMPLKEAAFRAASWHGRRAELTGAVNTLFFGTPSRDLPGIDSGDGAGPIGFNTDVGGIVVALAELGIREVETARIAGAGATAASALVALGELGARRVHVVARTPERAAPLVAIGERAGVAVQAEPFGAAHEPVDLTVATLPGGTVLPDAHAERLARAGGPLFDVAYDPWPSALARLWTDGEAHSGLGMLLHQAVLQVRVFTSGRLDTPLDREADVVAAMRAALMGE